jgi:hypothetical protein
MPPVDQILKLPPDTANTGKNLDASELTVAGQVVERERINIADPTDPAAIAAVKNGALAGTEYGEVVRVASMPPASISNFPAVQAVSQAVPPWLVNVNQNPAGSQDSNNEQTVSLGSGATFNGTFTRVDHMGQFQILYASTVPFTLNIIWSTDGVTDMPPPFGISPQVAFQQGGYYVVYFIGGPNNIAPYYRMQIINGPQAQGAFPSFISINWLSPIPYGGAFMFLNDALTNISKALLTRAVVAGFDTSGNFTNVGTTVTGELRTADYDPQTQKFGRTSLRRANVDAEQARLVGDEFTRGFDTLLWSTTGTTGIISQATGQCVLDTTTGTNGACLMQSSQTFYYHSTVAHLWNGAVTLDPGINNNIRRWGMFDVNNGVFFELNGTILNVVTRNSGVDVRIPQAQWNAGSSFVLDTNRHVYEIEYVSDEVVFYVDLVAVHRMSGNTASPRFAVNDFPIRFENVNRAGIQTQVKMMLRGTSFNRFGVTDERPRFLNIAAAQTTTMKFGPGSLRKIIVNTAQLGATATIYDSTTGSGTKIATVDCSNSAKTLLYDLDFTNGLTVVTTGSVPADITVMWT